MRRLRLWYVAMAMVVATLFLYGCSEEQAAPSADTDLNWYARLPLDDPEAATETVGRAFEQRQFVPVFVLLHQDTQSQVQRNITRAHWSQLYPGVDEEALPGFMQHPSEHGPLIIFEFESRMIPAVESGEFTYDLSGLIVEAAEISASEGRALVEARSSEGITYTLDWRQASTGDWRLYDVDRAGNTWIFD